MVAALETATRYQRHPISLLRRCLGGNGGCQGGGINQLRHKAAVGLRFHCTFVVCAGVSPASGCTGVGGGDWPERRGEGGLMVQLFG